LLCKYSLLRECVYWAVVSQWTSALVSLFRRSGVMSQYVYLCFILRGFTIRNFENLCIMAIRNKYKHKRATRRESNFHVKLALSSKQQLSRVLLGKQIYCISSWDLLKKIKVRLCDHLAVYVCIPHINFWTPEPIFMKLGMYIMTPEPISTAYFINPSYQSVCIVLSLLGNGSVNTSWWQTNTRNRRITGRVVFCAVCVVPKESL
jgi:hypothetical protein